MAEKRDRDERVERDWRAALAYVNREYHTSWPQALSQARAMTPDQLRAAEQTPAVLQARKEKDVHD